MSGDNQGRSPGYPRSDQQPAAHDAERVRQAQQAERGERPEQGVEAPGSELEPRDSRNVTGVGGAGTGSPGGADQQEGAARWGGDAQQDLSAAARQPDATTAAGQQPGIDRRELQAEQQAHAPRQGTSGAATATPEARHMAAAHVPGQPQAPQPGDRRGEVSQSIGQSGMYQSMGGMSQGFTASEAAQAGEQAATAPDPEARGYVDQQSASLGGSDHAPGSSAASAAGQIREHMEVVGADGVHLGTVDAVEGDRIKLTKADSDAGYEGGSHHGHHHYIACALVAGIDGNRVRLSATAANAYAMEEEK